MSDSALGSRHRAAVGLTKESDAIVVIVSEETGSLRISERGRLHGPFTVAELSAQLKSRLGREPVEQPEEESEPIESHQSLPSGEHAAARHSRQGSA
jgi:diadenylate cyclase